MVEKGEVYNDRNVKYGRFSMKKSIEKTNIYAWLTAIIFALIISSVVYSHCQIPCGIYDDKMRLEMMAEHITTLEKSIKMINQLSSENERNMNQITRWVQNKENHADQLSHIITYYFMAQRLKPADESGSSDHEYYVTQLTLLHKMLISSMKAKQGTDISEIQRLNELLSEFVKVYCEGQEKSN
jgi:nickel superoxide dismutase